MGSPMGANFTSVTFSPGISPMSRKLLPQGSRPAHCVNNGTFADLQFF